MLDIGNDFGCFIVGSGYLSPADVVLYKARDVTATVDNAGLIIGKYFTKNVDRKINDTPSLLPSHSIGRTRARVCYFIHYASVLCIASIISKKAAAGVKYLVLDLKIGSASFFRRVDEARPFARKFVSHVCIYLPFNVIISGSSFCIAKESFSSSSSCPLISSDPRRDFEKLGILNIHAKFEMKSGNSKERSRHFVEVPLDPLYPQHVFFWRNIENDVPFCSMTNRTVGHPNNFVTTTGAHANISYRSNDGSDGYVT